LSQCAALATIPPGVGPGRVRRAGRQLPLTGGESAASLAAGAAKAVDAMSVVGDVTIAGAPGVSHPGFIFRCEVACGFGYDLGCDCAAAMGTEPRAGIGIGYGSVAGAESMVGSVTIAGANVVAAGTSSVTSVTIADSSVVATGRSKYGSGLGCRTCLR
jgi:hypothetical protein